MVVEGDVILSGQDQVFPTLFTYSTFVLLVSLLYLRDGYTISDVLRKISLP